MTVKYPSVVACQINYFCLSTFINSICLSTPSIDAPTSLEPITRLISSSSPCIISMIHFIRSSASRLTMYIAPLVEYLE